MEKFLKGKKLARSETRESFRPFFISRMKSVLEEEEHIEDFQWICYVRTRFVNINNLSDLLN